MEKFALLNLLKAIDGLKNAQPMQNPVSPPPATGSPVAEKAETKTQQPMQMPNIMYETLMRHEQMSNRIHNKR